MRSLYSIDQIHCPAATNKERPQSSSESNDDGINDDFDETFANFLKDSIIDQPAPLGSYDNVIDEAMSDIFSPSADVEGGLLCDDTLFLAPGGPDLIEAATDASIDLSQLCPEIVDCTEGILKPEPRSPPSPGGSDSGVEAYSVGFEYCDSPPVTPPQPVTVTAAPPAAIIQVIKQEAPLPAPPRPLRVDTTPRQVICFGTGTTKASRPLAKTRSLQPKAAPIRPAGAADFILPHTVSPGSTSTTYIITTPAAAPVTQPAAQPAAIQPRPTGAAPRPRSCPRPPPAVSPSDDVPKARPLPRTVTVPPTRDNMDPRVLKRHERIIKNRMAACLSRKKKKDQFSEMEARVKEFQQANARLREENSQLHRQVARLKTEVEMLRGSLQTPASPPPPVSPRRPLLLLSLLLVASLNLAPLGSLFSSLLSLSPELGGDGSGGGMVARAPGGRTLLWAPPDAEADLNYLAEAVNASSGHMCPKHVNQTEARRLSRVLHGWFDAAPSRPDNGTARQPSPSAARRPDGATGTRSSAGQRRRKRPLRKRHSLRPADLQLYDRWFGTYGAFMDAIERRDDTFYVVSFNGDHLMLPALSHNQTQRPRMSLLLPSLPLNESMRAPEHHVSMMQIDCEVVNTKLLHIHESAIPSPPSGHSAPAGDGDGGGHLNDTGARGKLNFPAANTDGAAVDTALRWNGSVPAGERQKAKSGKPARGKPAVNVTEQTPSAPSNSSVDSWRKLRFGNDSVDGAGAAATFGHVPRGARQRQQRQPRAAQDLVGTASSDYFSSEH